jgi:hypothetical protein
MGNATINHIKQISALIALLLLSGSMVFGQSQFRVDVPFTFHTANTMMAPGKYTVEQVPTGATPYYRIRHESGKTILVLAAQSIQRNSGTGGGELAFECAGEYCALKAVYPAHEVTGIGVAVRMRPEVKGLRTAEVRIPAVALTVR